MSLQEMERQANKLIEQGKIDPAVRHIYDLVVALAKKKDFNKANAWRDKLIEINPMAFTVIINSSEVIEAEKAKTIDYNHQKIWEHLYYSLTQEEGISLYSKLKQIDFPPGEVLIQQGKLNNSLYLIDSGQLNTVFSQGEKAVFINELKQGDIAGQDTFFSISYCTLSVITASPAKIRVLERSALLYIENEFLGFTKKLESFCIQIQANNIETILKEKKLERRQCKRYKLAGKITLQINDKRGTPVGAAFHGLLDDISVGGAAFIIKSSNMYVGRTLLGRLATLSVQFKKGPQIKFMGLILGAKFDLSSAYKVHLKFSTPFDESKLEEIAAICPPSKDFGACCSPSANGGLFELKS